MTERALSRVVSVQPETKQTVKRKPTTKEILAGVNSQLDQARKDDPTFGQFFSMSKEEAAKYLKDKGKEVFLGYHHDEKTGDLVAPKNIGEGIKNVLSGFAKEGIHFATTIDVDKALKAKDIKELAESSDIVALGEAAKQSIDNNDYKSAAKYAFFAAASIPGSPSKFATSSARTAVTRDVAATASRATIATERLASKGVNTVASAERSTFNWLEREGRNTVVSTGSVTIDRLARETRSVNETLGDYYRQKAERDAANRAASVSGSSAMKTGGGAAATRTTSSANISNRYAKDVHEAYAVAKTTGDRAAVNAVYASFARFVKATAR